MNYKSLCLVTARDCRWTDWEEGECSVTCAGGRRTNTRTKAVVERDGTDGTIGICEGEATMEEDCNTQACPRKFYYVAVRALIKPSI